MPEQRALVGLGHQQTYERGQVVVHEGDRSRVAYLLLRGCVKVLSTSSTGNSVMLAVRLAGDLVGELAALDGQPRSATLLSAARTTVRAIGHQEFNAHLNRSSLVADAVHRGVVAKLRQSTRLRSDVNSAGGGLIRLARVLQELGEQYGRPSPQGVLLDVHLTQPELAGLIGVAEATVQRALGELRTRGLVRTGYRQLLLRDMAGLRALAAEAGE